MIEHFVVELGLENCLSKSQVTIKTGEKGVFHEHQGRTAGRTVICSSCGTAVR